MGKYEALGQFLAASETEELPLRFAEVERMLGAPLPASAFQYREWWANQNRSQSKSWMDAGWQVWSVDLGGEKVVFRRAAATRRPVGRPSAIQPAGHRWMAPAITIPEGRLGPAAMKAIENHAEQQRCSLSDAAAALLDQVGLDIRRDLFARLDALGMKKDPVSSVDLIRADRERDEH